jgi:hypothetical protein
MKPRNKYEKRVAELNATLSEDIAVRDIEWVKKQDYGYKREDSKDTSFYFTLVTQVAEYQVKRLYRGYKFSDKHFDHYFFVEIMREFSEDGCNALYFGKQKTMGCYFDCFLYGSNMELRSSHRNYARNSIADLFDISWGEHPQSKGKRVPCERLDPKELGRIIKNNPVAENLYKERSPLFVHLMYQTYNKQICRAITIAKRHGFVFDQINTSIWFDMVRAMVRVGADVHNPVFVAPKDLQATHDLFVNRWKRKQENERRAAAIELKMSETDRKLMREKRTNDAYIRRRKRFYDMVLTDGLIEVRVLPDVPAFRAEADEMHHCVYTNEYYKKPYSLIMSATISGSRVETVEVDLTSFKILQCFGKHDQFTMHHQRILDLVNGQMNIIKETYTSRKRTTKVKIAV